MASQPQVLQPKGRKKAGRVMMLVLLALLVALAAFQAFTVKPRAPQAYLQGRRVLVLGHQGASAYAPSNTLESFKLALEQGADILELDVHMTKDGVIVVSHDETIDRMSNGSGYIKSMTLAELRQYDFGYKFTPDNGQTYPWRGRGVTIPTLEDVFRTFPGQRVNIELKQVDPPTEQAVWDVIQKYHMADKVLLNAFPNEPMARWNKLVGDQTATGGSELNMIAFAAYYLPHLDWLYHPKVDAFQIPTDQKVLGIDIRLDQKRLIDRAHKLGIKVHYWTIDDEATMRYLVSIGADGIITDRPDVAVKVLQEAGLR